MQCSVCNVTSGSSLSRIAHAPKTPHYTSHRALPKRFANGKGSSPYIFYGARGGKAALNAPSPGSLYLMSSSRYSTVNNPPRVTLIFVGRMLPAIQMAMTCSLLRLLYLLLLYLLACGTPRSSFRSFQFLQSYSCHSKLRAFHYGGHSQSPDDTVFLQMHAAG